MVLLATLSCAVFGLTGWPLVFVVLSTASGQASVGWSNDYLDAKTDTALERSSKPVVRDGLNPNYLRVPILASLILVVPLSFLAGGFIGGLAHLLAVASAWAYNIFFARTGWSWLPYGVSFGFLPVFLAQAISRSLWPTWQLVCLSVTIGVIAHLLNAIPDIEIDKTSNLGGLAVRLGRKRAFWLAGALALLAIIFLGLWLR